MSEEESDKSARRATSTVCSSACICKTAPDVIFFSSTIGAGVVSQAGKEIGSLLQSIQGALASVESAGPAAGQGIAAQAAQLSAVIKRRSATLARRL